MLNSGFADQAFFDFANPLTGTIKQLITDEEQAYWTIINSIDNPIFFNRNTLMSAITPICFSGPSFGTSDKILHNLVTQVQDLAAGFIQTRCVMTDGEETNELFVDSRLAYINEPRTTYRIPLHLDVADLKSRMKRDSKSRINKWLTSSREIVIDVEKSDRNITTFSEIYSDTAMRGAFSASYQFDFHQWKRLLTSDNWHLCLVKIDGEIVGGSILTSTHDGIEYVFMGSTQQFQDLGRLVLFQSYQYGCHLNSNPNGYFYLGGGISENDALAKFKVSMGGEPVSFKRIKFLVLEHLQQQLPNESIMMKLKQRWPG